MLTMLYGNHNAERHRRVAGAAVTGAADEQHEAERRRERHDAQEQNAVLQPPGRRNPDKCADRRSEQQQHRGHDCAGKDGKHQRLAQRGVDQAAMRRGRSASNDGDRAHAGGGRDQPSTPMM